MVFVMVLPWHWLLRKLALAKSFDLFPMVFLATEHPRDHERLVEDFFDAANSIALAS